MGSVTGVPPPGHTSRSDEEWRSESAGLRLVLSRVSPHTYRQAVTSLVFRQPTVIDEFVEYQGVLGAHGPEGSRGQSMRGKPSRPEGTAMVPGPPGRGDLAGLVHRHRSWVAGSVPDEQDTNTPGVRMSTRCTSRRADCR